MSGMPVWKLASLAEPKPLTTAYSLSLDTPDAMGESARKNDHRPLLKLKLGGSGDDVARVAAVRKGAPDAMLIVDRSEEHTSELQSLMRISYAVFGLKQN